MAAPFDDTKSLAKAIWEARSAAHLSQQGLADYLGVSIGTVKRWEAAEEGSLGKTVQARRSTAILVAEATGRRDLLGLDTPEPSAVDQMRDEFRQDLKEALLRVTKERAEALAPLEDRLSRLEAGASADELTGS
jgi:transcriptional regulator with XRE-family HTH domain